MNAKYCIGAAAVLLTACTSATAPNAPLVRQFLDHSGTYVGTFSDIDASKSGAITLAISQFPVAFFNIPRDSVAGTTTWTGGRPHTGVAGGDVYQPDPTAPVAGPYVNRGFSLTMTFADACGGRASMNGYFSGDSLFGEWYATDCTGSYHSDAVMVRQH